jgi:hypothetical protein
MVYRKTQTWTPFKETNSEGKINSIASVVGRTRPTAGMTSSPGAHQQQHFSYEALPGIWTLDAVTSELLGHLQS